MAETTGRRKNPTQGEESSAAVIERSFLLLFVQLWNARLAGYEESGKIFATQDSSKSGEFEDYLDLLLRFATDTNENAREKGLDALLIYVQEAYFARM
jgi:hypothetical protein